jgi:hypothetical protein
MGSMQAADWPRRFASKHAVYIAKVLFVTAKTFSLLGELFGCQLAVF